MNNKVRRNCRFCGYYQCEEVGDSDYGAIYADTPSCSQYFDLDADESEIPNFDREVERECCCLEFFLVLEADEELKRIFDEEMQNESCNYDKSYEAFWSKYIKAAPPEYPGLWKGVLL